MDRARSCHRPGCSVAPVAVLSYSYAERRAWVDDLVGEHVEPSAHPLCATHADAFGPPRGWTSEDRRRAAGARFPRAIAV